MKLDTALQAIIHFFNDIIGAVVPGFVFLGGLVVMYEGLLNKRELALAASNTYFVVAVLAVSFASGHALLAVYKDVVEIAFKKTGLVNGSKANIHLAQASKPYLLFKSVFEDNMVKNFGSQFQSNIEGWSFHELRNIAMSISSEAASLGQRFMFISLLCNGVGTALILLCLNFLLCFYFAPELLNTYCHALPALVQVPMLILSATFLIRRGDEFQKRAFGLPFCVVNSSFWEQDKNNGAVI